LIPAAPLTESVLAHPNVVDLLCSDYNDGLEHPPTLPPKDISSSDTIEMPVSLAPSQIDVVDMSVSDYLTSPPISYFRPYLSGATKGAQFIAIGRKVFSTLCGIRYSRDKNHGHITLLSRGVPIHNIDLDDKSLLDIKYYVPQPNLKHSSKHIGDGSKSFFLSTFLVLAVKPNRFNRLTIYPEHYKPGNFGLSNERYIVVMFYLPEAFHVLLQTMRNDKILGPTLIKPSSLLSPQLAEIYGKSLLQICNSIPKGRKSSPTNTKRNNLILPSEPVTNKNKSLHRRMQSTPPDERMLVFPFIAQGDLMKEAACGLKEACNIEPLPPPKPFISMAPSALQRNFTHAHHFSAIAIGKTMPVQRDHFLTICQKDFSRLDPGEFLNDTLIDFWFKWYVSFTRTCSIYENLLIP
jgi:hypothetical protein